MNNHDNNLLITSKQDLKRLDKFIFLGIAPLNMSRESMSVVVEASLKRIVPYAKGYMKWRGMPSRYICFIRHTLPEGTATIMLSTSILRHEQIIRLIPNRLHRVIFNVVIRKSLLFSRTIRLVIAVSQ